MGRQGILLTLTDTGASRCPLPAAPGIAFFDRRGHLVASGTFPRTAIVLAPGARGYGHAVWSDGVGGNGPCTDATKVTLRALPGPGLSRAVEAHICASGPSPRLTLYAFSHSPAP